MRSLAMVLVSPTAALGYTFGDWTSDGGYSPGDAMPSQVRAGFEIPPAIDSLDGIGEFDWATTPTLTLSLPRNQISSIEPDDFSGLTNLTRLWLSSNQMPWKCRKPSHQSV